jgi:glycosyltransferase involved in cell wall biosynthesis
VADRTGGIDVVIPCYNYAHFVRRAVESAMDQQPPPARVIVIDDGSTDDPGSALTGTRAEVVRQPNLGLAAARNAGLRHSTADYVLFLDADDELLPGALAAGVASLRASPEVAFTCGSFVLSEAGAERRHVPVLGDDPFESFLRGNQAGAIHSVLFRRRPLADEGGFRPYRGCEDYDAYLRLSRRWNALTHSTVVARYRVHEAGMSHDRVLMLESAIRCLFDAREREPWSDVYERAFRAGIRRWKSLYGPSVVAELLRAALRGDRAGRTRAAGALLAGGALGWGALATSALRSLRPRRA